MLVAAAVVLAVITAVSTLAATHFHRQVAQLQRQAPAVASAPSVATPVPRVAATSAVSTPAAATLTPTAAPPLSAPPLTVRTFNLEMPRPHVTVYLAAAAADGVGFTDGQLVVTALVRGGQRGARYRLTGGDCDLNGSDKVWAEGVADTAGTAYLTGRTRGESLDE